jgi:magnesium transporter
MKVLTMLSTIFLPMTVLTGIYGMNFENMPELGWKYGYYMALGILVIIPVSMFWYFRKRGWFD